MIMTGRERVRGNTVKYKTQLKDIINNFSQPEDLLYRETNELEFHRLDFPLLSWTLCM